MPAFAVLAICSALAHTGAASPACSIAPSAAQSGSPSSNARLPGLRIDARQREAVRAAAAPYRGSAVRVLVHKPTREYEAFARGLAMALEAAGLMVSTEVVDAYDVSDCPRRPGLSVMYGTVRSGAMNAIAEALMRSRTVSNSISGCWVPRDNEFTFIVSGAAP